MIRQGKVRYIGCSNMPSWQVATAQWTAKDIGATPFVSAQDEYSLVVRDAERELIPTLQHYGLGLLPYFPLASGLLTGKYKRNAPMPEGARLTNTQRLANRYLTDGNWEKAEKLGDYAAAQGRTMVELAFSWLASQPVVSSVIAGATRPEQIAANVKAADWALTADDVAAIDAITRA
jgi:aryl-alcohol dehydrogenase-like predicted oxidoreductase